MTKKMTDDNELKIEIINKLKYNKKKYGRPYCPCINPEFYNEKAVCPCEDFRKNTKVGEECCCGLYIKISD